MYSLITVIEIAFVCFFVGIIVMYIGIKVYAAIVEGVPYTEKDDCPDEEWVQECFQKSRRWSNYNEP